MIWKLKQLIQSNDSMTFINNKWVPARPINYKYRSIIEKMREAYAVLTGNAEAFTWPEGQ
jgi:hypothetical protein